MVNLSIIIVNYNSGHYTALLLDSILKSHFPDKNFEILVVDNASGDNSRDILQSYESEKIRLLVNKSNVGFARANNEGIRQSGGKYVLLINPDTAVEEHTIPFLMHFLEQTPDVGIVTGKLLNPDGTFAIDSRHGIPTPLDAFWKVTGISRLFPKSKRFNNYHQTFLDENLSAQVPAVSGAFMLIRREVIEKTGLLDETFFMYCEDIDYCYRTGINGFKLWYVPDVRILHFKGESSQKNNFSYHRQFSRSLLDFYQKYHKKSIHIFLDLLITSGIWMRGFLIWLKYVLKSNREPHFLLKNSKFLYLTSDKHHEINLRNYLGTGFQTIVWEKSDDFSKISHLFKSSEKEPIVVFDLSLSWSTIFDIMEISKPQKWEYRFYDKRNNVIIGSGVVQPLV